LSLHVHQVNHLELLSSSKRAAVTASEISDFINVAIHQKTLIELTQPCETFVNIAQAAFANKTRFTTPTISPPVFLASHDHVLKHQHNKSAFSRPISQQVTHDIHSLYQGKYLVCT